MNTVKKFVLVAAVIPVAFASTSVLAFGGKGDHQGGRCHGGMERSLFKQLDLTSEQKDKLQELRSANKAEMKAHRQANRAANRAELQSYHAKVQKLVLADNFDQNAANELAKQMVEKQTERRVQMLEKRHQMLSVLTPEQKAKFVQLSNERMEKCADKYQGRK